MFLEKGRKMRSAKWNILISCAIATLFALSGCAPASSAGNGNTPGNISNTAYAASSGNFIYYATDAIYKAKSDGTGAETLSGDIAAHLNVADGWIYYSNRSDLHRLYKMKTDGTAKEQLDNDVSTFINIAGDWIYYINGSDSNRIYKMKTDGTLNTSVGDSRASALLIQGDWLFYINTAD